MLYQLNTKSGKPTQEMGKTLYKLIKHNEKFGGLLYSKAGFCWTITLLKGGESDFDNLFEKWGDERPTSKQWRALFAISKSADYEIKDYQRILQAIIG